MAQAHIESSWKNKLNRVGLGLAAFAMLGGVPSVSEAQDTAEAPDVEPANFLDALGGGKIDVNLRFRAEFVDQDGLDNATALTERLRLGYGTLPYEGWTFYIGFEDLRSADYDGYNAAGLNNQPGRAVIADPEDTELNELYAKYDWDEHDVTFKLGRQRLKLDDLRFVGNVGWRQLEQTFDAATVKWAANDDVDVLYSYLWEINRIFGDSADLDFESESHIFNVSYDGFEVGKLTGFAYLLDFDNSPANSSNTFGVRFTGDHELSEEYTLKYMLSLARQSDAGSNTTSYDADYYFIDAEVAKAELGSVGVGYEVLGSDNGVASFRTPLATLHKFNGWADVFLTTPAAGLEDLYIYAKADLPWEVQGKIVHHWFDSESGGGELGSELDLVLSKKLSSNWTVTAKLAEFDGDSGLADRTKFWLQMTFTF